MASSQDAWYLALLGLAEHFRTSSPPQIRMCIQCLQAVFQFKPPPRVEARTHLQLATLLLAHTNNLDLAKSHLEQAWLLSQGLNSFDELKFEAASMLAQLYEQQEQPQLAKPVLRKAIELSQASVFWHCRLLFQLAQLHAHERDYLLALSLLSVGSDYAQLSGSQYTWVLFLLSRALLLLAQHQVAEAQPLMGQAGSIIENWQGNPAQREHLRAFFLVLQVSSALQSGRAKSGKPALKQLQQSVQALSTVEDELLISSNRFLWLPREQLCAVAYVLTVAHSMASGYMDKALKYTERALAQIEKLHNVPLCASLNVALREHVAMCHLVMGRKSSAIREISQALQFCRLYPKLFHMRRAQLHILLGLYAMSMSCLDASEAHFLASLRIANSAQQSELCAFANLNLAIVYLRGKRPNDAAALLERVNPESLFSHALRAAAYFVHGLRAFFSARHQEAKRHLREALKTANGEDLNRLTSCSLVLLGHIFLALGNSRESMNMVTPAMHLASKIPDVHVQLWASAILRDLHRMNDGGAREHEQMHLHFSDMLLREHLQSAQLIEHSLIHWSDNISPSLLTLPVIDSVQPNSALPSIMPNMTSVIVEQSNDSVVM